jgi:acetylornithine/N-succinyldiaminopimelate aminotransferase
LAVPIGVEHWLLPAPVIFFIPPYSRIFAHMNLRQIFLQHVAQTSPEPLGIEVARAQGMYIYDTSGKQYLDLIAGISVCNVGHCHPHVVQAIQQQAATYMHTLVYGEMVQSPQVLYAQLLTQHLPASLNSVYFTNSGAEAAEGAMKLAKRVTGRTQMLAFNNSYHGSTQGALSVMGSEYWRNAFRPLLPGVLHGNYNAFEALELITSETACVIAETIQAELGVQSPSREWMQALRKKCDEQGALLILDEIQAGFGRTGTLWGFEQFGIVPDVVLLGKALGGGMPLGAFVADAKLMQMFTRDPVLGHITTFGGHPVSCAAGMAAFNVLLDEQLMKGVTIKAEKFLKALHHPLIKAVHACGLWMAVEFDSFEINKRVIDFCLSEGILTDWFLFAPQCLRIAPPLIITEDEIEKVCAVMMQAMEGMNNEE